jgi:type IV secretion system protein VirB2
MMTMLNEVAPPSISNTRTTKNNEVIVTMIVVAICLLPDLAFAQTGGGGNPVLAFLNGIITFLNTGVMRAIAILAVFSLGVMCYLGRITFGVTAMICGGIILTFGAASLVDQFSAYVPA